MHNVLIPRPVDRALRVLCLGAHCDDIEIGCGGTLLSILERAPNAVDVTWIVFSGDDVREAEARASANRYSPTIKVDVRRFKNSYFPYEGAEIKNFFEELKVGLPSPDVVFTHARADAHQDHREISSLTRNTFRDHLILEFEIPKFDGDMGQPTVFHPIDEEIAHRKADLLLDSYRSQRSRPWFAKEVFLGLQRLRGMECNAPSGFAEAFYCSKLPLRFGTSPTV